MNCAITIRQPSTHPPPVSTTAATNKPATAPEAAKPIRSTDDLINEFPDCSRNWQIPQQIQNLTVMTHILWYMPPRKCPITLHLKVKEHLDKMECLGVITHVDEPTDWVSSITYVQKANGELCLCLDPHDLNEAICHDHHKMPTVEEVAHEFAHSCFFTKLDAAMDTGQLSSTRTPACSLPSTAPFSRYCFLQLPLWFGLFQDILQEKMDQILKEMPKMYQNCRWHHHTWPHRGRTWCLPMRSYASCPQIWLGVQPTEDTHKSPSCQLLWCLYNANGVHLDPGKVNAVHALPAPNNVTELPRILRSSYIPKSLHPWSIHLDCPSTRAAQEGHRLQLELYLWHHFWNRSRKLLFSDTTLRYFDPSLPVTIQVDASQVGLGAALLQDGKPVAFASKALTKTECWYANIEREMLAAVFRAERFHTYVYGQSFTIK